MGEQEYLNGWNAWVEGEEFPPPDATAAWLRGFKEAAWEYPRDDQ